MTAELGRPARSSNRVLEKNDDPGTYDYPEKLLSSPQSLKKSLELSGINYQGPGEDRGGQGRLPARGRL